MDKKIFDLIQLTGMEGNKGGRDQGGMKSMRTEESPLRPSLFLPLQQMPDLPPRRFVKPGDALRMSTKPDQVY